jgi:predicted RND superfamily exporter protein
MVDEFEKTEGISNVISLNTFVGPAISESLLPDAVKEICQKGGYRLMMVNSVYATATDNGNKQIDELLSILHKYDPNGYLTGEGALCKDLVDVTARDFKITSIISIAAIFILIAIVFKSITIPFILVGCIELAIFINQSVSFLLGAEIPFVAPTIIGCVQLGATVDYAILLTTRFKEELQHTPNKYEAMKTAAIASGRSIFQSAIVFFSATFGVYLICNISIVKSICSMLARGAIISALVIMIFLPSLLCICEKFINKTTYQWRPKGE